MLSEEAKQDYDRLNPYEILNLLEPYGANIDYVEEVKKYGESLNPIDKPVAREVFRQLLESGRDYKFLFFVIQRLNGRSIKKYRRLCFSSEFQQEVEYEADSRDYIEEVNKRWQEN